MKDNIVYNKILKTRSLLLEKSSEDIQRYSSAKGKGDNIFDNKIGKKDLNQDLSNSITRIFYDVFNSTGEVLTNWEIVQKINTVSNGGQYKLEKDPAKEIGVIYNSNIVLPTKLKGPNKEEDIVEYIGFDDNDKNVLNSSFNKINGFEKPFISRFSNPSLAVYKLRTNQASIRSSKETDFVPVFTNMIPQIEMSRCSPHLNIVIVDDSEIPDERVSLGKFLVGKNQFKTDGFARGLSSVTLQNKNDAVFKVQSNISLQRNKGKLSPQSVSGMEIFLSPQALINADINRFQMGSNRVVDPYRPFMSIESFSIQDYLSGYKFLSSVKGSLNLKLYDRSRLPEISKLIGVKYLSSVSLIIEYGWNHPEGHIISNNPFGQYLNSLKRRELFKITSNRMSINDDGTVNISLDLISISTNNKSVTSLNSKYITVENLNEYLELIKKKLKGLDKKDYRVSLKENLINSANLSKRSNDLIELSSLYKIKFFQRFEAIIYNVIDGEVDINNQINPFLSDLKDILYPEDSGPVEGSTEASSSENDTSSIKSSSIEYLKEIISFLNTNDTLIVQQDLVVTDDRVKNFVGPDLVAARINTISSDPETNFKSLEKNKFKIGEEEKEVSKYITLGRLLTRLFFLPMLNNREHDEMQVYFHTANHYAGGFHDISLGDVFIDTERFLKSIKQILEKSQTSTLDIDTIFQIVREILGNNDPYEIGYCVNDINSQLGGYIDPEAKDEKRKELIENRNKRLAKIYDIGDSSDALKTLDFIPINLQMRTDVKVKLDEFKIPRKIVQIHVYDKAQEKYTSAKQMLEGINNSDVSLFLDTIKIGNIKNINTGVRKFTRNISKNLGKSLKKHTTDEIQKESKIAKNINNYVAINIDKIIKSEVPTIEFGSNSAIIENIAISNDSGGLANEINLYRYVTGKSNPQDNSTQQNTETLFINPSKITIQMLGCPLISIGQEFYVTAGTNTTLDTIYHVESLSHNITEGSFRTTVTLQAAGGASYRPSNITKNIITIANQIRKS